MTEAAMMFNERLLWVICGFSCFNSNNVSSLANVSFNEITRRYSNEKFLSIDWYLSGSCERNMRQLDSIDH